MREDAEGCPVWGDELEGAFDELGVFGVVEDEVAEEDAIIGVHFRAKCLGSWGTPQVTLHADEDTQTQSHTVTDSHRHRHTHTRIHTQS